MWTVDGEDYFCCMCVRTCVFARSRVLERVFLEG